MATASRLDHGPRRKMIVRKWFVAIPVGACIVLLGLFWVLRNSHREPNRVVRQHAAGIPAQYRGLTLRPGASRQGYVYSRKQAEDDLDQLEWLIDHEYSYRDLKGVDYRACLDAIRSGLGEGITRGDFAYQLAKFLALFGDGHTGVGSGSVSIKNLCSRFLPFLVSEVNGRLVAYRADRSDFLDPNYPFLRALDARPVAEWIEAGRQWVADGSPQFVRLHSIRYLRCVEFLRKELGCEAGESIRIELESPDGQASRIIEMSLVGERPYYGIWPPLTDRPENFEDIEAETRRLAENIGYVRIPMMLTTPRFLDSLVAAMREHAETDGLVIDVRGNGGGSRAPLRTLYPFFMADDEPPQVVNVAAYRLGTRDRGEAFAQRYLYPAASKRWSDAERKAIQEFAAAFHPAWSVPEDMLSVWHFFVIGPGRQERTYHYSKPVVILQDAVCFSATDIFLGAFKGRKNVTLMGSPSGGGSGCRIKHRLQNSFSVYLSSMVSYRPNGQLYDGRGIEPDIHVRPRSEFFIGKKDSVLERAVELLNQKIGRRFRAKR